MAELNDTLSRLAYAAANVGTPGAACVYSLSTAIMEICIRAGMDPRLVDTADLGEYPLRGFAVISNYPAMEALRALSQIYFFDPSNYDGQLHFIVRGKDAQVTVTEDDMLDDDQDIEQTTKADSIQIPRVLHMNYQDIYGGLAPDKQTSERSGDRRATGEVSLQTAVVMASNEAAMVVHINHKVMIENQKGELKFSLSDRFLGLTPADNVFVQWQGRTERVRIIRIDLFDGYQQYTCLRDRQSAYSIANLNIQGIPPATQTPPPSSIVGPTLIVPLDIHILRDADDGLGIGIYMAVSGIFPAWSGALIELSYDNGANYVESGESRISAIMGELMTPLGDHPVEFPDEHNTCAVRIDTPNGDLFDTNLGGMMNRENLAAIGTLADGWELINFSQTEEESEGLWSIGSLLRGRKGSGSRAHIAGEKFVMLDRGFISFQVGSVTDIGRTLTFRATSFGTSTDVGTVVSLVFAGRSQIERQVGYLAARRTTGSNVEVTWQGVGRLGGGGAVAHGARFSGYRVVFDDGSTELEIDTANQSLIQDVSTLTPPIAIRVYQLNDLTGEGPAAEVIIT
jgi:hypothetical protein